MALPGITQARADYRAAQQVTKDADEVVLNVLQAIAAKHAAHTYGLTWSEREQLRIVTEALTLAEAEQRRLGDLVNFMEET